MHLHRIIVSIALLLTLAAWSRAEEEQRPEYNPPAGLSGTLSIVGSDTMGGLLKLWAASFESAHPDVDVTVQTRGSATAPPALIDGSAAIAAMSRPMSEREIAEFAARHGHPPHRIRAAVDALAIYVHRSNPIERLSLDQLRRIYADASRELTWGDVGVTGDWAGRRINAYGRNRMSGTHEFFAAAVLDGKGYKPTVTEKPGSAAVVQAVADDVNGIGYAGIGFATVEVRAVPIVTDSGAACPPTAEHVYAGEYPLTRTLYLYIDPARADAARPLIRSFLHLVLSAQGQQAVRRHGYFPAPTAWSRDDLAPLAAPSADSD